jgi:hypothetical protein
LLASQSVQPTWTAILRHTYNILNDANTQDYQRQMLVNNGERFSVNIRDEIVGLEVCRFCLLAIIFDLERFEIP